MEEQQGMVEAGATPEETPEETEAAASLLVSVLSMSGEVLAEVRLVPPATIAQLKVSIMETTNIAVALQKLVKSGEEVGIYEDGETLPPEGADPTAEMEVVLVVDETPLCYWNVAGNPNKEYLQAEGGNLTCPTMRCDFVNVYTHEPIRMGRHYFKFVMHHIGDEQWCGVSESEDEAGRRTGGRSLKAWSYYCGRMNSSSDNLNDGMASLQTPTQVLTKAKKPKKNGSVIGMALDVERGVVAFDLDGEVQGAMRVPNKGPLHIFTHVDKPEDHVELLRPPLREAPEATMAALEGELLSEEKGVKKGWGY